MPPLKSSVVPLARAKLPLLLPPAESCKLPVFRFTLPLAALSKPMKSAVVAVPLFV